MGKEVQIGGLSLGVIIALWAAAHTKDPVFAIHSWIVVGACLLAIWRLAGTFDKKPAGKYNEDVVRAGVIATAFWGIVGFLIGVVIALQLAFPVLNFDTAYTNLSNVSTYGTN